MKIAAAEAQWTTCQPCSFSLFQIGGNNDHTPTQTLAIPHLLSLLATNSWNGKVTEVWLIVAGAAMFAAFPGDFRPPRLLGSGPPGNVPGPGQPARMAGKPCSRVAAGRDHPREAMPAGRACAQIAGPELKELRWQQTRLTH